MPILRFLQGLHLNKHRDGVLRKWRHWKTLEKTNEQAIGREQNLEIFHRNVSWAALFALFSHFASRHQDDQHVFRER